MTQNYRKIISFFRKCADAEDSKAFRIPPNEKNVFYVNAYRSEIKKILFGDEPFFSISGEPKFSEFFKYWTLNKKNHHIFLAIDIIKKREKTGTALLPLYMIEVFIEEIEESNGEEGSSPEAGNFRISIADSEPTFNRSLLDPSLSVADQFLLLDEIIEESDWISKRNLFLNHIDSSLLDSQITEPVFFISNLQVVKSAVSGELEWIERAYLDKIPDTALSCIFDRVINSSPEYAKTKYLEIFPMDRVQREVVQFALNNPFTVITGPPGTGKSQVVLNLIANIYMNGKTVLFASKNNKAVNTVIEKLEYIQDGFCPFIRLGNRNEKDKGLQRILSGLNGKMPKKPGVFLDELKSISESIEYLYKKMEKSERHFEAYCSSLNSIATKSKDIPSHLQKLLFGGLLKRIDQYEAECHKLTKKLKNKNQTYLKNQKTLDDLQKHLKKLESKLAKAADNVISFHPLYSGAKEKDLPALDRQSSGELAHLIENIEKQKTLNEELQAQIEETNSQQRKLESYLDELEIGFEYFVANSFDHDLRLLIEENFDQIADTINSSYFEINKLKADIDVFLQRKEGFIGSVFVSVWDPRFERKCYKRFEKFLTEQSDIVSKYAVTQTSELNMDNLHKVVNVLSKIPECVNNLKKIKYGADEVQKVQLEKSELIKKIEMKNFLRIEEDVKKFSKMIQYPLSSSTFHNHIDYIDHWLKHAKIVEIIVDYLIDYQDLKSKFGKCEKDIEQIIPQTKLSFFNDFFDEVDAYLKDTQICSESPPIFFSNRRTFEDYREALKDSWSIIQNLMELSEIYKNCVDLENKIRSEASAEEIQSAVTVKQKRLVENSIVTFNHFLYSQINPKKADFEQNIRAYHKNWKDGVLDGLFQKIKEALGIFVITNLSTRYNIPNKPALFDFVIIDEASQNDIASVLPLFFRAKYAIIIGDPNQLKHISHLKNHMIEKMADEFKIGSSLIDYHYIKVSAFDLSAKAFQETTGKTPFVLKNHYRCHPDIIQFSNHEFYNSRLFPKAFTDKDISPIKPGVTWRNVQGKYTDHENLEEADAIVRFIEDSFRNGLKSDVSIGIITPFRNQKKLLISILYRKKLITGKPNDRILASTVHSFQGDERDIIIYSPVLSKGINIRTQEWLDKSTELLNVAITRARNALIVFGDAEFCMQTSGLHRKLLVYCLSAEELSDLPSFESRAEKNFYEALQSSGFDFQYQVPVGRYRADFILKKEDRFVCIELDGYQHDQTKSYDYTRDRYFKELGYDVVRIPSNFVENNMDAIIPLLRKVVL